MPSQFCYENYFLKAKRFELNVAERPNRKAVFLPEEKPITDLQEIYIMVLILHF